nr:237_t:CDS:2 [Entrophospora candida]
MLDSSGKHDGIILPLDPTSLARAVITKIGEICKIPEERVQKILDHEVEIFEQLKIILINLLDKFHHDDSSDELMEILSIGNNSPSTVSIFTFSSDGFETNGGDYGGAESKFH